VLVPKSPAGRLKSVCKDTALLFLTLRDPGKLPAYLAASQVADLNETIAGLVLDSVLEICVDGRYLTGRDAYPHMFADGDFPMARQRLGNLSLEAVQHAQLLGLHDVSKLSARLYFYNRLPATPRWKRLLGDAERVKSALGCGEGTAVEGILRRNFSEVPQGTSHQGWYMWRSRRAVSDRSPRKVSYKLYISPHMTCLGEAFAATVEIAASLRAPVFKVGRDLYGLLRPDKLICYFSSQEKLLEAAAHIEKETAGLTSHGVPFTAPFGESGLVSWGVDPPLGERALPWHEDSSWRLWVTNQLAIGLVSARDQKNVEPWRFALDRLQLKGVDTMTWEPRDCLWQDEIA
jgi:hypothetical protein